MSMKTTMALTAALAMVAGGYAWAGCGSCGSHGSEGKGMQSGCGMEKQHKHGRQAEACGKDGSCKADYDAKAQHSEAQAELSTPALKALVQSQTPLVLLDARSGKYDDGRRIPGAQAVHAGQSKSEIMSAAGPKDTLVVTYCSNLECPASAQLAKRLRELGYRHVLEYPHGIEGWAAAGHEVEHADA